ncbi:gamma-glutamylcyclotransferase a [Stigmatopora nigra]
MPINWRTAHYVLVSVLAASCTVANNSEMCGDVLTSQGGPESGNTFVYFAFGSNMLKERISLLNPSATFLDTGRLKDHRLDFGLWAENAESNSWHGGVATIQEKPGSEVWGVIWTMNRDHLASLDCQEGVHRGFYSPLEVRVESSGHGEMTCRTYKMNNFHARPTSPQYKHVICLGAQQNGLPEVYVDGLRAIQTNNYTGPSTLDRIQVDVVDD